MVGVKTAASTPKPPSGWNQSRKRTNHGTALPGLRRSHPIRWALDPRGCHERRGDVSSRDDQPPRETDLAGAQGIEVEPGRDGRTVGPAEVPAQAVPPGGELPIGESANESASEIAHCHLDPGGMGQREADGRWAGGGIWIALSQLHPRRAGGFGNSGDRTEVERVAEAFDEVRHD